MRIDPFLPSGLSYVLSYVARFRRLGLPPALGWRRRYRRWLELSGLELLPPHLRTSPAFVVDVGANVGDWSLAMAYLAGARRILAFEPDPAIFALLKQNTRQADQIECRQQAVGASCGEVGFYVEAMSQLSSVLPLRDDMRQVHGISSPGQKISVPMTTLDHELAGCDEVTLLKVDVQGYDAEVLVGAREVLKRTQGLMLEVVYVPCYEGDRQFESSLQLVSSLSPLKLYGVSAPHCSGEGRPIWADAVFVREA